MSAMPMSLRRRITVEDSESDVEPEEDNSKFSQRQVSQASTAYSWEELSSPAFFSRQCTEIDWLTCRVAEESNIKKAMMTAAVSDANFCVTVANPRGDDVPLIAVSEKFEAMTGYRRSEMLGRSCRFLNQGCPVDLTALSTLRRACRTGSSFTGVLTNQRKSGELFLNLLDLHGLTVARNHRTGEHLWFLIGIHADVTAEASAIGSELPPRRLEEIHQVAKSIRWKLAEDFSRMAVSGALLANINNPGVDAGAEEWVLLPSPVWIDEDGNASSRRGADPRVTPQGSPSGQSSAADMPEQTPEPEVACWSRGEPASPGVAEPPDLHRGAVLAAAPAPSGAIAQVATDLCLQWLLVGSAAMVSAAWAVARLRRAAS